MTIRCYGIDWAPTVDMVGVGTLRRDSPKVDLRKQFGIYVMYKGDRTVYVGKSARGDSAGIYGRLYCHWYEEGRRWDTYSWFGFRSVGTDGALLDFDTTRTEEGAISDIEALLIHLLRPGWNEMRGAFAHMEEFRQVLPDL